jgi:membrane protease YdiL (CAAX protease family)
VIENKGVLSNSNPFMKLLLLVGMMLLGAILFSFIAISLCNLIYGVSLSEVANLAQLVASEDSLKYLNALKLMQAIQSIGVFILPSLIFLYLLKPEKSIQNISWKWWIPLSIVSIFAIGPALELFYEWNLAINFPEGLKEIESALKLMEEQAFELTKSFLKFDGIASLLSALVVVAVIPAIGEELIFRKILTPLFSKWFKNIHIGIWVSAILFSAIHFQFYGFLPRMVIGGLLGYIFMYSGSIWMAILAHFINNASIVVYTYFTGSYNSETLGLPLYVELLSVVVSVSLIYFMYVQHTKQQKLLI